VHWTRRKNLTNKYKEKNNEQRKEDQLKDVENLANDSDVSERGTLVPIWQDALPML
jgi:hypothetical protein